MSNWIDITKRQPKEVGWYNCKTIHGEYPIAFARTAGGQLKWVVRDELTITHWQETDTAK